MLVLTLREKDDIFLGETEFELGDHIIKFSVLQVNKGKIKIGIEAPEGIEILRSKLLEERSNANRHGNAEADVPGCVS